MKYARRAPGKVLFEIQQGFVARGASISWLSQYPNEEEILFPPLTALEVRESRVEGSVLIVNLQPSMKPPSIKTGNADVQAQKREAQQLEMAAAAHVKELARRSKAAATWTRRRNNITRQLKRSNAASEREAARAKAAAAEVQSTAADNAALHAELGESVKIAAQRQAGHTNAQFTFQTVRRDLKVR